MKTKKLSKIEFKHQRVLIVWAAIICLYGFIFYYVPLVGWLMAFQNYKPVLGVFKSEFIGLDKFKFLFEDESFIRVIRNTFAMGIINLVCTFVMAILFAILLNEIKTKGSKKVVQTISYLPHFLSWIIVTGILQYFSNFSSFICLLITSPSLSHISLIISSITSTVTLQAQSNTHMIKI